MLEDLEYDTLLHQKEVRAIQMKIVSALEQPNNADELAVINNQIEAIGRLIEVIRNVKYPEISPVINVDAPKVNVDVHQSEVTNAINGVMAAITEAQTKIIKLMTDLLTEAKRCKETEFSFKKDKDGEILSPIIARQIK